MGEKIPRKQNGVTFEVITETKVAEHFEESMMPCRISDILQIIMLAPARTQRCELTART